MKKTVILTLLAALSSPVLAEDVVSPADMSPEAQHKMFEMVTDYNKCMMQNRLQMNQSGKDAQSSAQDILQSCENHLDELKVYLTDNHINHALAEGMAKKLRSRAARQLMNRTMNNLAAQAAAMENAEKMQQQ